MANLAILQKLVDSSHRFVSIETDAPERIVEMFHRFNIETGCAVYDWNNNSGLNRIGFEHILIPRTKTSSEILSYIATARHFGIYLIKTPKEFLSGVSSSQQITDIYCKTDSVKRLIVFIGNSHEIPSFVKERCATIRHSREQKPQTKTEKIAKAPVRKSIFDTSASPNSASGIDIKQSSSPKKGFKRIFGKSRAAVANG